MASPIRLLYIAVEAVSRLKELNWSSRPEVFAFRPLKRKISDSHRDDFIIHSSWDIILLKGTCLLPILFGKEQNPNWAGMRTQPSPGGFISPYLVPTVNFIYFLLCLLCLLRNSQTFPKVFHNITAIMPPSFNLNEAL